MLVLNPWRLGLLFLVSGVATRFMLRKYSLLPLLRSRSARLLIPLVFGMLVIVPPQAYEQIVEALRLSGRLRRFLPAALFGVRLAILPEPLHRAADVEPSVVRGLSLGLHRGAGRRAGLVFPVLPSWIERELASALSGALLLLVVPSLAFATYRLVLFPNFPSTHALFGDWYNHAHVRNRVPARLPARAGGGLLGRDRAPALDRAIACGRVLSRRFHRRFGRRRDADMPLLRLFGGFAYGCLSMAVHGRHAWLCAALAHGGFGRAALSDRCDLSLLHRAPDRDHHDRACAQGQHLSRPEASIVIAGHRGHLRGYLRGRTADRLVAAAVRTADGRARGRDAAQGG